MNNIPRHTHSMEIEFSTKGFLLLRTTIPLKLKPVVNISDWYSKTKVALANAYGIPVANVKGKHQKVESKFHNRILFEWAGGISLDMPDDCDAYDYKIILHYLEGVKMSLPAHRTH
jgi:hypothetical protein